MQCLKCTRLQDYWCMNWCPIKPCRRKHGKNTPTTIPAGHEWGGCVKSMVPLLLPLGSKWVNDLHKDFWQDYQWCTQKHINTWEDISSMNCNCKSLYNVDMFHPKFIKQKWKRGYVTHLRCLLIPCVYPIALYVTRTLS